MIAINELRRLAQRYVGVTSAAPIMPATAIELLDRLEAAEKDIALKERIIDSLGVTLNAVANERDALRAHVEAMEKQEPSSSTTATGYGNRFPLYLATGARGE